MATQSQIHKLRAFTEKPLPANLDAERFVLGAIMCDPDAFVKTAAALTADDFSLEKHKRIFLRMGELQERGESIDRVTLANELTKRGQLDSVDGLGYLVSLDDGLPQLHNIEAYIAIVKENSVMRLFALMMLDSHRRAMANQDNPYTLIAATESALISLSDSNRNSAALYTPTRIIEEYKGGVNSFLDPSKRPAGLKTGFLKLDEMTGGFRDGDLVILAARPAMGKSSLALNAAQHIAMHPTNPKAVAFFSLEMSKESLLTRLVCAVASVDQQRFRAGYLSHVERVSLSDALDRISEALFFFDDTPGTNLMTIHAKVRRLMAEVDLGLVVVDYLQLMQGHGENRVQQVASLSRGFKLMAKELHMPFLVLSQLSRGPETRTGDHRPIMSDLRDSGSIEQDADAIAFIFREEVYRPDKESLRGIAELILAKQREGPTGRIKLAFLHRFTRFENLAADTGEEGAFE